MAFTPCLKKPQGANPYYIKTPAGLSHCILGNNSRGQRDPVLNVLPNCVGLALARLSETNGRWIGIKGNACDFIKNCGAAGLTYQQAPTLGGIMVWAGGSGAGHVAFVEQLNNDGSITTSESEWNGAVFTTYRRSGKNWTDGCAWMRKGYTYLGCVINPAVKEEEPPKDELPTVTIKNAQTGDLVPLIGFIKDGRTYAQLNDLAEKGFMEPLGWDGTHPVLTPIKK